MKMHHFLKIQNLVITFSSILIIGLVIFLFLSFFDFINKDLAVVFATLLIGVITVDVIYWQGSLIKQQIQFQTYLELEKEWNGKDMIEARETVTGSNDPKFPILETILEFLEKFSLFKKRNAMDIDFILSSTIGWYAVRYYYYNKENIVLLQKQYGDNQLYVDLQDLYHDYIALELGNFWGRVEQKKVKEFELNMDNTKAEFMKGESEN